jgi:putative PIN family toxin of toxin-antitoxin system
LELIDELETTTAKPKLKKYFGPHALEEMLLVFESLIDLVDVKSTSKICRDPKDNFLLALAKDGKADYLLTGDQDLLDIKKYGRTKITTISKFLEKEK